MATDANGAVTNLPEGYTVDQQAATTAQPIQASALPSGYQVDATPKSTLADPFAQFGGTAHKPTFAEQAQQGRESRPGYLPPNSVGPQLSTGQQLRQDPGMPLRNKIREIENYTQEGKQVHPILATIGDYLKKVYVPSPEVPNDMEHPLASPVPPPLPGMSGALEAAGAESAAAKAAATSAAPAAAEAAPSLASKIIKGAKVAQPKAAGAIRTAASAATEVPAVQPLSLPLVLDQPIDATEAQAKSLYSQIDAASGTDMKALREKLANTEYNIRNLGDTEEDRALEAKYEASRTGLINKIEQAKQDAIKAGVDPGTLDQADAMYKKAQALRDVQKIFQTPSNIYGSARAGQEEMINVKPTVQALQKLQYADKFGSSRLEQALGEQNANALLGKLYQAERLGQSAIRAHNIAKWIGITGAGAVGAGTVADITEHLISGKH